MERQTVPGATKRPKEPIGPLARFRRCKHLRLGSFEPRSVVVTADASTCDHAFGPSWPLRAEPTVRARWRVWLWAYPRTSDRTGAFGARCPRSVHGAGGEQGAVGGRGGASMRGWASLAGGASDGARRQARRGAKSGPGHGNARRNRRSSAESPRASSSGLKAPAHRPLRAKSTMTCPAGPWLPAYPRPSRLGGRNQGGCPPPVHVAAEHREVRGPGRNETPEGTNRSAGPFPPMQAPATRFLRTPVRSRHRRCKHLRPRFRSVMAPSGRTNSTGAMAGLAMGLSTNFGPNRRIRSALSTVRPRSRWRTGRGGWSRRFGSGWTAVAGRPGGRAAGPTRAALNVNARLGVAPPRSPR